MTASATRLHISPLTPEILPTILGSELYKTATDISYHSIQTFPENNYGYVVLPKMEAEKVKKKFNGAILKGKKVKIEEARPSKRKHISESLGEGPTNDDGGDQVSTQRKRSRREGNALSGHELSPGRKVKRGWTEDAAEKSKLKIKGKKERSNRDMKPQANSKYSEKAELLFKTKVPKNRSSDSVKDSKRRKKDKAGAEVVHEFENSTTMPSFLRNDASSRKGAVAYKDGEGWIDDAGNVIEVEDSKTSKRRKMARYGIETEVKEAQPAQPLRRKKQDSVAVRTDTDNDAGSRSSEDQDIVGGTTGIMEGSAEQKSDSSIDTDETSSSGTSEADTTSDIVSDPDSAKANGNVADSAEHTPPKTAVHPLEALFKKPTKPASSNATGHSQDVIKPSLEVQTSFSFFDPQDDNDGLPVMPMTPFSSQDLRRREIRSAAPTPDTAHPSRMSSIFNGEESDGELSEMSDSQLRNEATSASQRSNSQNLSIPETDFEKQFWEKRGENNRSWKARRRAVLKEKRQRENRARRPNNW